MSMYTKQTDERKLLRIQKLIRESAMDVDFTDRIMHRVYQQKPRKSFQPLKRNRAAWIAASIGAFLIFVASTSFVSPAMAESLKKIPVLSSLFQVAGDLGLRTADESGMVTRLEAQDTHDGITLHVPLVAYDGNRVSLGLERRSDSGATNPIINQIDTIQLEINGKPVQTYAPGNSNTIGITTIPGMDNDSAIIEFSDLHNQGGKAFPDKFLLSLTIYMNGVAEPYAIDIPIANNAADSQKMEPDIHRIHDNIAFALSKVELTKVTTTITTKIAVPDDTELSLQMKTMGVEVVDEKGNKLKLLRGNSWNGTDGHSLVSEYRFEPVKSDYHSLTIKPFFYYFQKDGHNFIMDENGNPKIQYVDAFEVTLPANE